MWQARHCPLGTLRNGASLGSWQGEGLGGGTVVLPRPRLPREGNRGQVLVLQAAVLMGRHMVSSTSLTDLWGFN